MSSGGLIIGIVLLLGGIVYLALPLVRGGKSGVNAQQERERLQMLAAYERALVIVRDLDEDYQVGKLSPDIYETERTRWTEHGAMLLEMLETASEGESKKGSKRRKAADPVVTEDDAVEQAIAAYVRAREQSQVKAQDKN